MFKKLLGCHLQNLYSILLSRNLNIFFHLVPKKNMEIIFPLKTPLKKTETAVSPVIGVMLMLTITLILAAIISGFTGGIAQKQEKPPSLLLDATIVNHSSLNIAILSVSEGIPTRDLKFITEWRAKNGTLIRNVIETGSDKKGHEWRYPIGITANSTAIYVSDFGNYSLLAGSRMTANTSEALNTLFSPDIFEGDNVKIEFVHIPSGAIIAEKELTVEGE